MWLVLEMSAAVRDQSRDTIKCFLADFADVRSSI